MIFLMTIRLKNGPEGLEIRLRPDTNWLLMCIQVFALLLAGFIDFSAGLGPALNRLRSGSLHVGDSAGNGAIALIFAAILAAILYAMVKQLFGYQRVVVNAEQLTIEACIRLEVYLGYISSILTHSAREYLCYK